LTMKCSCSWSSCGDSSMLVSLWNT
jgi:hypothetical protein